MLTKHKIIEDINLLKEKLLEEKKQNKKIVFTNGCFDLIHQGHIILLQKAKSEGDLLVVAINSDDSIKKLKGKNRPIFPEYERAEILASFWMVDFVTIFNEETPYKIISGLKPDVLVKGGDWKIAEVVGRDIVETNGGRVVIIPQVESSSTSEIIDKIKNQ
ncbi:MAG: D-glycero-beta-D-manno-heptose 1-phosphate adenylyltransferase [Candidatus Omnitrophica bacterium]|nr:D-glycero-beta-D-manno-heptose 1-phosphate adenylyltransferase [Candidatus Omnitrophota bacterium]MBU1047896.1 D-glycero-beta-D-manno-heptose 1-phosphate adenylyltransferase [Candidatus Omnitrophota bacterium]MBU1630786.1 D-glycero-beta-D-manno-heptose 1-phosphate adenylyltransferase [Candidatus Omnitrophota bacterium]MBU1766956.1 D-glycero-beta-D-manno-heptose 1-phosphate adenylyltransferase [Candidatus Omnitrophota bacterium]MBU1888519.1 D-glycero-beta-D-manno-heptose 1-phosphate adenylylt